MQYQPSDYLPIIVQLIAAIGFIVATMIATHSLGPKRNTKLKNEVFECGIESVGDARTPISVKYFLVAILFVLFDVEVIFMYPWAVNFIHWVNASAAVAKEMFLEMLVFMALLLTGFVYVIKKGILHWEK